MKKKNLLMMALSLCMVAVVAVGGTLAYLTDTDNAAKNTFTFAEDIEVSLTEATPTEGLGNATATAQTGGKGVAYSNVVVNQELPKEPKIQLTKYTVDTYVFAKIDNNTNGAVTIGTINGAWDTVDAANGVYGRKVTVDATHAANTDTATALFSTVTIAQEPASGNSLGDITIYVSAIQAEGFDDITDAYNSIKDQDDAWGAWGTSAA